MNYKTLSVKCDIKGYEIDIEYSFLKKRELKRLCKVHKERYESVLKKVTGTRTKAALNRVLVISRLSKIEKERGKSEMIDLARIMLKKSDYTQLKYFGIESFNPIKIEGKLTLKIRDTK